ncbi:MAG: hypothetical protein R2761_30050 [Acidimicrobiales bacterium]
MTTANPLPLRSILELPPELSGALTFHLPLEVFALEDAGASPEHIQERMAAGLADAYRSGLVDPPFYRWAVEQYRPVAASLLSPGRAEREAAFASVLPLGEGLVGAAFHGLIRTGYGALRRDPDELARGLAYLRTRRQVLRGPSPAAGPAAEAAIPPPEASEGTTVFDQLSMAAGAGGDNPLADTGHPLPPAPELAARAAELLRHDAGSFVSVHAMTGLHGLAEVHHLVTGEAPAAGLDATILGPWWRAWAIGLVACTAVVTATPAVGRTERAPAFTDTPALMAAAVASGDTHSVKLAVALRRLVAFGVLDETALWELGAIKLGVPEC